jgi:hypothetical protein
VVPSDDLVLSVDRRQKQCLVEPAIPRIFGFLFCDRQLRRF